MRLQAYLARAGASPSRRKAEALISAGRVTVNGATAELGVNVSETDKVSLDGKTISLPTAMTYLALNKPSGYLTTMHDDRGRATVSDLMPEVPGLVPVGRLDAQTTGLLILTNDGDFANTIAHPSSEIEKQYAVKVRNPIPDAAIEALRSGPELDDGPMLPPRLTNLKRGREVTTFDLTIHEGRNRIIRRACEAVGLDLISLERVGIGPVRLGALKPGETRTLTEAEISALKPARGDRP